MDRKYLIRAFISVIALGLSISALVYIDFKIFNRGMALFLVLTFLFLCLMLSPKNRDFYSPWFCFPAAYYLLFGIGSIRWLITDTYNNDLLMFLVTGGFISYFIGTILIKNVIPVKLLKTTTWDRRKAINFSIVLYTIGFIGMLFFLLKAGTIPILAEDTLEGRGVIYDRGSNSLLFLGRLVTPAFLIYYSYYSINSSFEQNKVKIKYLFFISFLFMLSTASRQDLFFLVFTTIVIAYYSKRNFIKLTKKYVIISILLLIFILSYGYFRVYTTTPERIGYFEQQVLYFGFKNNPIKTALVYFWFQVSVYASNILIYLSYVPEKIPFFNGKVLLITLMTALPGKQSTLGQLFKENAGIEFQGGGVNPTIVGELYIEYGIPSVFIVMFIYGLIYRYLYENLKKDFSSTNILFYSYYTYILVSSLTGGFLSQLSKWFYLSVFLMATFLIKESKQTLK